MIINLSRIDFGGITGGKTKPEEVFDVQPTTTDQTITPTEGSVFSGGTVRAVTKEIDTNIVSNNIKEGVTILGVAGTLKEEKPEERFNVQPTTAEQTITPTAGSVFSGGTVKAVTAEIDANIASNNIKEGVTILGVAGTLKEEKPEERFNVQPTTAEQTITPTAGSVFSGGTVHAVTSAIDGNIVPENIKQGVAILGVTGTLSGGSAEDYIDFSTVQTFTENGEFPLELIDGKYAGNVYIDVPTSGSGTAEDYIDFSVVQSFTENGQFPLALMTNGKYAGNVFIDVHTTSNIYDGSFDEDGLRAIGWTDEDIAYFEEVNPHFAWQNDQYIVSEENKALYLLDDPNPSSYKNNPNIAFVPKKNMESYFAKPSGFRDMSHIKGIPFYSFSINSVSYMFSGCTNLTTIPLLNTSGIQYMQAAFDNCSSLTTIPQINTSNASDIYSMFRGCTGLKTIPQLDFSNATNAEALFQGCAALTTVPPINLSKVTDGQKVKNIFDGCTSLTSVEGIDFSGLTTSITNLFGSTTKMPKITRFIINGKLNETISDSYSIKALTKIDYDSVKSILTAADRTDNTNSKTLAFNRTMTDQNGELAALVSSCTSKGWRITGLTIQ